MDPRKQRPAVGTNGGSAGHRANPTPDRYATGGYLTTGDAARILGVTRQTVLRWVRAGSLPSAQTMGGHLRLRGTDVRHIAEQLGLIPPVTAASTSNGRQTGANRSTDNPEYQGQRIRLCAVVQGRYGRRIAQNIRDHGPDEWSMDVVELPIRLPPTVGDATDVLPIEMESCDLLLVLGEESGVAELIPDLARRSHAQAVLAPIDRTNWLSPPLRRQVESRLDRIGIPSAFPKPFCTLTEERYGFRGASEQYRSDVISEFARHFGQPRLRVVLDITGKEVGHVEIERDSACGCARYVAQRLEGLPVESAHEKAIHFHHLYPCLASIRREQISESVNDTLMHVSEHILTSAVDVCLDSSRRTVTTSNAKART